MQANDEARIYLADYNCWRLHTAQVAKKRQDGEWVGIYKETPDRLSLLTDMASWCRERGVDPRLWLYLLFRSRRWMFSPQLSSGHLMSEKMLPRYEQLVKHCLHGYREHILAASPSRRFDPNWEISQFAENLKEKYAKYGEHERCLRETLENTLGFHPKSKTCQECPVRVKCLVNLEKLVDFDVLALREGRITPEQAKQAVYGGQ